MRLIRFAFLFMLCLSIACSACAAGFTVETRPVTDAENVLKGYDDGYIYMNFGSYPYTADGQVMPCLWRVLETENGYAFLLNEYVVEMSTFHHVKTDQPSWKDYDIFGFINGEMINTMFTAEEQSLLRPSEELGKLFILDNLEFMKLSYGFKHVLTDPLPERKCLPTPYAIKQGAYVHKNRMTTYWSRSCRHTAAGGYEHIVGYDGHISMSGFLRSCGIRPACRVDMTRLTGVSGSGTKDDPYCFSTILP